MNNRKTNIKRFTKATATLMLCTAALNLTISKAHASDNTNQDQAPTSATYSSSSSSAVAPQSNTSQNNGNVAWNGKQNMTSNPTNTSSSNQTSTSTSNGTNDDSNPSPRTSTTTSTSGEAPTSIEQSSNNDTTTNNSNSSGPSDVAVSFVSNGRIVGTDYLPTDSGDVDISSIVPQGYQLQDLSQANIDSSSVNGIANITVHPNAPASSTNSNNDSSNNGNEPTPTDSSSEPNRNDTDSHQSSDTNGTNDNRAASDTTNVPSSGNAPSSSSDTNDATHGLSFPPVPSVSVNAKSKSHRDQPKRHPQPGANPREQYKHPVRQPTRVLTPSTPQRVNQHRTKHVSVNNPMLRPWHNPDRIKSTKDFRSQVHFTHRDRPRNVHRIKSYHDFDKTVLRYRPMLHKVTKHYHMTRYDKLFLAIMEVESKGSGKDIMQSSESAGLKLNSLDTEQSLEQAVRYMKSITDKAHAMDQVEHQDNRINPSDYHNYAHDDRLLAQAYNYGGGFLDYVAHSKYGYSESMSQEYSKDVVAKQLGNPNDETYAYNKPVAQMYHKNFLYKNGGNFLYADEVSQYLVSGYMKGILNNLMQYRGRPYVFGGKTPRTNFDCSGLVSYGFKTIGLDGFPDFTETQWHATKPVKDWGHAKPGDLIFFKGTYGDRDFISHVGFLLDRHTMLDSNSNGVEFTDLDQPYWRDHFAGIQRVPYRHRLNKMALQHQGTDNDQRDGFDDTPRVAR